MGGRGAGGPCADKHKPHANDRGGDPKPIASEFFFQEEPPDLEWLSGGGGDQTKGGPFFGTIHKTLALRGDSPYRGDDVTGKEGHKKKGFLKEVALEGRARINKTPSLWPRDAQWVSPWSYWCGGSGRNGTRGG